MVLVNFFKVLFSLHFCNRMKLKTRLNNVKYLYELN